ncbi:hypothetical protein V492_01268 [Pseudogymnoascus sp. VKM F-4246]|nr:hypothetical protein V492_01268 [Pseudogymnoascus sp. VKM F-4246]
MRFCFTGIVKHSPRVEQRERPAQRAFEQVLTATNPRASLNTKLVVQLVLPEPKDRHEIGPGAECHLNEPIPPPQHKPQPLPTHARQAQHENILPIKRDAEIRIQREQGIRDPGKQLRESQRLGGEGGEGAVADDPVRVVPEDVFARWAELTGAVQARGEVAGEEGPEFAAAEARGAEAEFPAVPGFGEHDVDHVGHD